MVSRKRYMPERWVRRFAAACVIGAVLAAGPVHGLTLVEDGKAVSTIVIPANSEWWTVQAAATYVQEYVAKATGAELKIVNEDEAPEGALISVGHTKLAEEAGIRTDDLELDSCRLIVKDNVLFLIGRDGNDHNATTPRGTCRAAVTFLERSLGVRWLIPSPQGEYVPEAQRVAVPGDLRETIISRYACMHAGPYSHATHPSHVANNSCSKIKLWTVGGHSWEEWVPVEEYFEEHPEYFAMIDGKRTNHKASYLCPSNPDVRKLMLREMRRLFDEGYDWVQLGQSDGMSPGRGVCECPDCDKLDSYQGNGLDVLEQNPCERILLAHKWIADECRKSHPDKTIHLLLYGPTRLPSKLFDTFGDNVVAENAIGSDEGFRRICEAWKGKVRAFTSYIYWEATTVVPLGILPTITPASVTEQMRYYHDNNVIGIYYCHNKLGKNWGLWGPVYYLVSRLMSDPDLNPNDVIKEYCRGVYGETAGIMQGFFEHLYSRVDRIKLGPAASIETKDLFLLYYPPNFVRQLDQMLSRAEQQAQTEKSKGWVRLTRDYFDYIKTLSDVLTAEKACQAMPTRPNLLQLRDRVDAFHAYRTRILSYTADQEYCNTWFPMHGFYSRYLMSDLRNTYTESVRNKPTAYGRIGAPLTWNFEKKLEEFGRPKDYKVSAAWTPTPPALDGHGTGGEWDAAATCELGEATGGEADVSTSVQLMYDDTSLYIRFVCEEPVIEKLEIPITGRDNAIWRVDCVEVMLDPEQSWRRHMHLIAAPRDGAFYDARTSAITDILDPVYGKQDASWNPDWRYGFSIDRGNKVWSIEMAVPFASMGLDAPAAGTTWRANFGRERFTGAEGISLWSPADEGSFHDLASYGEIEFGKQP